MTWSYSGNPASSDKDTVRFLVGDTKTDDPLVTDEEIDWAITEEINKYCAAALIAESISAYFATQADLVKIGPIWEQYTKRSENYAKKAKDLRNKSSNKNTFAVYAGGIDIADKINHYNDTTLIQPEFTKGFTDMDAVDTTPTDVRYS